MTTSAAGSTHNRPVEPKPALSRGDAAHLAAAAREPAHAAALRRRIEEERAYVYGLLRYCRPPVSAALIPAPRRDQESCPPAVPTMPLVRPRPAQTEDRANPIN